MHFVRSIPIPSSAATFFGTDLVAHQSVEHPFQVNVAEPNLMMRDNNPEFLLGMNCPIKAAQRIGSKLKLMTKK